MRIIIPMAGHSRRFSKAGYTDPKQFLNIDGVPMIERVCQMFDAKDDFVFVADKVQLKNEKYRNILENITHNYTIVEIESHENGPVYSVLQAEKEITNPKDPIIISYCDFYMNWDYRQFLLKSIQYDGAIAVFRGFHPASFGATFYAYLKSNDKLEMQELREKKSFTDNRTDEFASTGVYYLNSWEIFKKYALELLNNKNKTASEYYASLIYNYLVRDGLKVTLFEVKNFICWGTPEDIHEYMFWSKYFNSESNSVLNKVI
ncbi:NTP transferase domain-containing protein [bacterium]